jgi:hypothetical protein
MGLIFNKYFRHSVSETNRRLSLILDSSCDPTPTVIGAAWDGGDNPTLFRHDCGAAAVGLTTYRHSAQAWLSDGFAEVVPLNYWHGALPSEPQPKPDWQRALDELAVDVLAVGATPSSDGTAALAATPAATEPLYLWLAGIEKLEAHGDAPAALAFAVQAREEYAKRRASKAPFYGWSIWWPEIEGLIYDLMGTVYLAGERPRESIPAFERAYKVAANQYRGAFLAELLYELCPKRREEAFDLAYRYARFGGYERIVALPGYDAYAERRKKANGGKGWRWATMRLPASAADLRDAEQRLGAALPKDYQKFLKAGRTELLVRIDDASADLRFFRAAELATQRDNHIAFLTRTGEDAEGYLRKEYGVSLRDLVPVAEVANASRNLLVHVGAGERFGWCYRWDHEDSFELEAAQESFDEALKGLMSGIEARNSAVLGFVDVMLD